jgi:hypothetical protein
MTPEKTCANSKTTTLYQSLGWLASTVNMAAAITIDGNTRSG